MTSFVLETTPLDRNNSNTKTLLLGDWCNFDGEYRDHQKVHYYWDRRNQLAIDYHKIFLLFETYLNKLTLSLNSVHNTSYPVDYWRIIIGPWLYYFICIVFERHQMLYKASKDFDIKYTHMPEYSDECWKPNDFLDFKDNFSNDEWNYYIFSEILKCSKIIKTKNSNYRLQVKKNKPKEGYFKIIKSILFLLTKINNKYTKKIVFVEVDIPQIKLYKLLLRLKSFSFSYYLRVKPKIFKVQNDLRKNLLKNEGSSNFEKILDQLIPKNIPISYIEGYRDLVNESKTIFPKKAQLIITSNAYFSNEHFKVWAALQKLNDSQLWVLVHGGHHGTALYNGPGKLTEDIASRFYAWGWGNYNLPSSKLSLLRNKKIFNQGNKILFIPYSVSKYSNHIDSSPIGPSFNDCILMHKSFFKKLSHFGLINQILIRLKYEKQFWNLKSEYQKCNVENFIYSNQESLTDSVNRSALTIVTYDSTVFLEALTLNTPTCLFIRKDFWEMSDQATEFFDSFFECGILHYDEESLLNHIIDLNDNYQEWWLSDLVQNSVTSFLKQFGLSDKNWEEVWLNEIKDSLKNFN
jgi:putative transferase (TIGR04331 family)